MKIVGENGSQRFSQLIRHKEFGLYSNRYDLIATYNPGGEPFVHHVANVMSHNDLILCGG